MTSPEIRDTLARLAADVARLQELLREPELVAPTDKGNDPAVDPSIRQLAPRLGKSVSTVRGWCEQGRFPGAYQVNREWRVPAAAIEAYQRAARAEWEQARVAGRLSDWRTVRTTAS